MDATVWEVIAAISLAIAGVMLIILMSMARTIWSLKKARNSEERERRQIIDAIKQATRITCAHDVTVAVRKFIEQEQEKLPTLYIETDDPDEPYAPYDLNYAKRWMKPIRVLIENEFVWSEQTVHPEEANRGMKKDKGSTQSGDSTDNA